MPGDSQSTPEGINNAGQVVGISYNALNGGSSWQGFLYQNGTMTNLTSLLPPGTGWKVTSGIAINDQGQILALANSANGVEHTILLTPPNLPASPDAVFPLMPVPEPSTLVVFGVIGLALAARELRELRR